MNWENDAPSFLWKIYDLVQDDKVFEAEDFIYTVFKEIRSHQTTELRERIMEMKRTMAHIEGVKRVETDYVLLDDILSLLFPETSKGSEFETFTQDTVCTIHGREGCSINMQTGEHRALSPEKKEIDRKTLQATKDVRPQNDKECLCICHADDLPRGTTVTLDCPHCRKEEKYGIGNMSTNDW